MALYLVIQIGAFLSRVIPRSWRYLIGTAVGDAVFWIWSDKRRILLHNMSWVLGLPPRDPRVRRIALKSMRNYCKYLIEFLELPVLSPRDEIITRMKISGVEHFHAALDRGRGVIIASGHFGTIEIGALRLAGFTDDMSAVYDAFTPPYLDRLIRTKRRAMGINPIPVNGVREMLRSLRRGGVLVMLFDRPVDPARGAEVRFFGRSTAVPSGPAVLALKTGAPIVPMYMLRHADKSFECVVFPEVHINRSDDRERDVQAIMQRVIDTFQSVVRDRPDQWYMFRPMWPDMRASSHVPATDPSLDQQTADGR